MSATVLSIPDLIQTLRDHDRLGPELIHSQTLPGRPARHAELAEPLPEPLRGALAAQGVERLFSHQAEGLDAVRRGENVLVTTPTASGKSLVFHLPPLIEAAENGPGRALFLFPLKALGQDQRSKLDALARAAGLAPETARAAIYDGDTPRSERTKIRRHFPRVLVTNPDMLHLGVLGHWTGWAEYLRTLRWIVLDELHTYRGIFGTHFHHVLQRFLRVCRAEGGDPTLIASSATAENAGEFAESLAGRPFRWITESGAPRAGRHMLLFRPEASPYTTALNLFIELLRAGAKTIVFTKARRVTELLYSWLRRQDPELARRVASYRSGFLPEERRKIERRLFEGRLDGVISTSALEMGIDVGGLDACVLVGYPGSVMATWQRSGRAGRGGRESLTALVALPDALDQYFLEHPEQLLDRPCERLIVDPANRPVARAHLVCAAAELPLTPERDGDAAHGPGYWSRHGELIRELVEDRLLVASADGGEVYSPTRRPQRHVNLRGTGETYDIVDAGTGEMVGTVDGVRVLHECHPGAIYLHGGRQYQVETLDLDRRHVLARPGRFEYFTTPLTEKETEIVEVLDERRDGGGLVACLGRLEVTERVVGYERKRIPTQEVLGQHALELPPVEFETVGLWWRAPRAFEETLRREGEHFLGALHATEHAAISLFPILALCDRGDIGGISYHRHPQVECGAVFVYDGHPGGVGIAARGFRELPELLGRVLDLVDGCDCEAGCPWCIQSPKCGNGNRPLDKAGAARVVRMLLDREEPVEVSEEEPMPELEGPVTRRVVLPREAGSVAGWEPSPNVRREGTRGAPAAAGKRPARDSPGPSSDHRSSSHQAGGSGVGASLTPREGGEGTRELGGDPVEPSRGGRKRPARDSPGPSTDSRASACREDAPPGSEAAGLRAGRRRNHQEPRRDTRDTGRDGEMGGDPVNLGGLPVDTLPLTVLFDLETLRSADEVGGWGNAHRMGVSVGVVCLLEEGRFEVFREEGVAELAELLEGASLVVGFNVKRFDYRVLSGYTGVDYRRMVETLDLMEDVQRRIGFRVGLDHLARETLGAEKSGDGLQALEWVRQGRLDLVEDYCRRDVELTRDLYLYGRREGCVWLRHRRRGRLRVPVEW